MGSAMFIPVAQVLFQNELIKTVRGTVPDIDPYTVLVAGANKEAIDTFPQDLIPGILSSYAQALSRASAVAIPLAGVSLIVALFMPWFRYHNESQTLKASKGEQTVEEATAEGDVHETNGKMG
jgi:hypothetical protein